MSSVSSGGTDTDRKLSSRQEAKGSQKIDKKTKSQMTPATKLFGPGEMAGQKSQEEDEENTTIVSDTHLEMPLGDNLKVDNLTKDDQAEETDTLLGRENKKSGHTDEGQFFQTGMDDTEPIPVDRTEGSDSDTSTSDSSTEDKKLPGLSPHREGLDRPKSRLGYRHNTG